MLINIFTMLKIKLEVIKCFPNFYFANILMFSSSLHFSYVNYRKIITIKVYHNSKLGGKFKREEIYAFLWLIHIDIWQKPKQFCKAIILQLKTK